VAAVELGRATFANIRKFLTYHLTDNVAELAPFVVWGVTAGHIPLALTVLQILALDIGTDLLPALALGAEPPNDRVLDSPARKTSLVDGGLLRRAFLVLGLTEAVVAVFAFVAVLTAGGWSWGEEPSDSLLSVASGTAFTAVVLGQLANAFACRSETRWVGRLAWNTNHLLLGAVATELALLIVFVGFPPLAQLLGGSWPSSLGWSAAPSRFPPWCWRTQSTRRSGPSRIVDVGGPTTTDARLHAVRQGMPLRLARRLGTPGPEETAGPFPMGS
jgi:magnesium-transporting ATPase (P-type)